MTHTVQLVNSYLTKPLTDITYAIVQSFQRGFFALVEARQKQANWRIAQLLQRNEYRDHSIHAIFAAVNDGRLDTLK